MDNIKNFNFWLEAILKDYAREPFCFLRELAQNSRDADASIITVQAGRTANQKEFIVFSDNGCGMTLSHAQRYLFRLYASSKENDPQAAGKFGIGFWSILKFKPLAFRIESLPETGGKGWAVIGDQNLNFQETEHSLQHPGTRITLLREPSFQSAEEFCKKVATNLVKYCRFLKKKTNLNEPLPILFNNNLINQEIELQNKTKIKFKFPDLEGTVSLGSEPEVTIYGQGLFVWKGNSLNELLDRATISNRALHLIPAQYPVYLLNSAKLDLQISRKAPIDNRHLQKIKKIADRMWHRLLKSSLNNAFEFSVFQKIKNQLISGFYKMKKAGIIQLILLLLLLIPVEIYILKKIQPSGESKSEQKSSSTQKTLPEKAVFTAL